MLNAAISLAAIAFLLALMAYLIQLISNNIRFYNISRRGSELEAQLLRARVDQIVDLIRMDSRKENVIWNGLRKFQIVLKVKETDQVSSFYLSPHDGKPLPPFLPGQYLTFKLNIPGTFKPVIRCYSLSDSPNHPDYYRVTIKRLQPPENNNVPPGLGSNFFHDMLNERDIVDVKAPSGQFHLDMSNQNPVVLIGGGVGLTPLLSMLNTITEKDSKGATSKRETWFFLGVRNQTEHMMKEHLESLAQTHANLFLNVCYSQPQKDDVQGRDFQHAEHISGSLLKKVLPSNNFDFYICAPPKLIEALRKDLAQWSVPDKNIHYEAFNSATIKKLTADETGVESSIKVTFARSRKTIQWNPAAGSILAFAEENGIMLESGCRAGNCGTCLTAIKRGLVNYVVEPGSKPEARSCLTCISVPKTDLTLDG